MLTARSATFSFVVLLCVASIAYCDRILFHVLATNHVLGFKLVGKELAKRGHEVWIAVHVTDAEKTQDLANTDIRSLVYGSMNSTSTQQLIKVKKRMSMITQGVNEPLLERLSRSLETIRALEDVSRALLEDKAAMDVLTDNKPDFIIVDTVPTASGMFMLPLTLNCPFGYWTPIYSTSTVLNFSPAWAPFGILPLSDRMTFSNRLLNTFVSNVYEMVAYGMKSYFWAEHGMSYPGMASLSQQASIILVDTSIVVDYPFPYPPNVIPVGCLQCHANVQPLPTDLNVFIRTAKRGVIYIALGSHVKTLPQSVLGGLKLIISANKFPGIKFIVVHKGPSLEHEDIYETTHAPQRSILAEKKTLLFVSHCGTNGQLEGVYFGKIILCLPLFADQFHNAARQAYHKAGRWENYKTMKPDQFLGTVQDLLDSPIYTIGAQELKRRFRDMPHTPLEAAVHWIDYVLKHWGQHLHWKGESLAWYQSSLLDVYIVLLVLCCFACVIVYWSIRISCRCFCRTCFRCRHEHVKVD